MPNVFLRLMPSQGKCFQTETSTVVIRGFNTYYLTVPSNTFLFTGDLLALEIRYDTSFQILVTRKGINYCPIAILPILCKVLEKIVDQ